MNYEFLPYFIIICGIIVALTTNYAAKRRAKISASLMKGKVKYEEAVKMFRIIFAILSGFLIVWGLVLLFK